jgi:hypothetical protein
VAHLNSILSLILLSKDAFVKSFRILKTKIVTGSSDLAPDTRVVTGSKGIVLASGNQKATPHIILNQNLRGSDSASFAISNANAVYGTSILVT